MYLFIYLFLFLFFYLFIYLFLFLFLFISSVFIALDHGAHSGMLENGVYLLKLRLGEYAATLLSCCHRRVSIRNIRKDAQKVPK